MDSKILVQIVYCMGFVFLSHYYKERNEKGSPKPIV